MKFLALTKVLSLYLGQIIFDQLSSIAVVKIHEVKRSWRHLLAAIENNWLEALNPDDCQFKRQYEIWLINSMKTPFSIFHATSYFTWMLIKQNRQSESTKSEDAWLLFLFVFLWNWPKVQRDKSTLQRHQTSNKKSIFYDIWLKNYPQKGPRSFKIFCIFCEILPFTL